MSSLAAAVVAFSGGRTWLPAPLIASLLPAAGGAWVGALTYLGLRARDDPRHRRWLRHVAVTGAVALLLVGPILHYDVDALAKGAFGLWSPLLAGLAAAVWLAGYLLERRRATPRLLVTELLAGLALAAVLLHNGHSVHEALAGRLVRAWNVYHYYVGSKYFRELGYRDLYAATLAADDEWQERKAAAPPALRTAMAAEPDFAEIERARDLTTYAIVPRAELTRAFDRRAFTAARWAEFGEDTRALRAALHDKSWPEVMIDLGYNPSPAWTVLGAPLSNALDITGPGRWWMANSDLPLLLAMFAAMWWAFGARVAFVGAVWLNAIHFNQWRFAGGYLQYDWLACSVIGLALYHRGRGALAGTVLSWAVATRLFPGLLLVPIVVRVVADLCRNRGPWYRRTSARRLRMLLAVGACSMAWVAASHATGRGVQTWPDWYDKIARHAELHPLTDAQRIGLGRLVQHCPRPGAPWATAAGTVAERLQASAPSKWAVTTLGLLLLLAASLRRRDEDAMVLMLFAVFLAVTVSRYYASIWVLAFSLGAVDRNHRIAWPAVVSGLFLLLMAALFFASGDRAGRYFIANYQALAMFVVLCLGYLYGDVREWRARSLPSPNSAAPTAPVS